MRKGDANQQALQQVERLTASKPVDGEDLLQSQRLKREYRQIKKQLAKPLPKPARKKPVK